MVSGPAHWITCDLVNKACTGAAAYVIRQSLASSDDGATLLLDSRSTHAQLDAGPPGLAQYPLVALQIIGRPLTAVPAHAMAVPSASNCYAPCPWPPLPPPVMQSVAWRT